MVHDQYSDKSFRVFATKIHEFGPEARDMLKTAEVDPAEGEKLPSHAFAWPEMRKYAMHTKEHTVLSSIYAHGEQVPDHVTANLEKAAELYGIELPAIEKVAEETPEDIQDYLVPQKKIGKIEDRGMVKEAADFFSNNYKKMNLETRAHAAATIVKKAREYDCKISPTFYKHAGLTLTNPKVLGEWLEVRSNLSKDETVKSGFSKLAEHVQDPNEFKYGSRQDLIKLADTIAILDRKANLVPKYDLTLPDPLLTVFNTSKFAEETITLANKSVPVSKLYEIDPQTYGDILGEDIVPEISKDGELQEENLADVLKTLPADLQSLLVSTLGL